MTFQIRSVRLPALIVLGLLATAACGSTTAAEPQSTANAAEVQSYGGQQLIDAAEKEGALSVYTALDEPSNQAMTAAFRLRFPKIDVKVTRLGGGELQQRIIAEKGASKLSADVIEQTDAAFMSTLDKQYGIVADYTSPSVADYPAESVLNNKIYPGYVQLTAITYNSKVVPADQAPKTWADFLNSSFNGQRATIPPTAGGCSWTLALFQRKVLGEQYWTDLAATKPKLLNSNTQIVQLVGKGEIKISTILNTVFNSAIAQGAPLVIVYPPEGVPPCQIAVGAVKSAAHPNAAKLWLNWLLSESGQKVWVDKLHGYSARNGMPTPAGVPANVKVWAVPVDEYLSLHDGWIKDWNKVFNFKVGS